MGTLQCCGVMFQYWLTVCSSQLATFNSHLPEQVVFICLEDSSCVTSNPCLNGGTCVQSFGGGYTCDCTFSWSGPNCELGKLYLVKKIVSSWTRLIFKKLDYPKCVKTCSRGSNFPNFLEGMPIETPSKILPRPCQWSGYGPGRLHSNVSCSIWLLRLFCQAIRYLEGPSTVIRELHLYCNEAKLLHFSGFSASLSFIFIQLELIINSSVS